MLHDHLVPPGGGNNNSSFCKSKNKYANDLLQLKNDQLGHFVDPLFFRITMHLLCWASCCPDPSCGDPASTLLIRSVEWKAVGFGGIILWSLAYCLQICCCNQTYIHWCWAVNLNSHAVMLGNSCSYDPLITSLTSMKALQLELFKAFRPTLAADLLHM